MSFIPPNIKLESQQLVFLPIWNGPTSKLALTPRFAPIENYLYCCWPHKLIPHQHPQWLTTTASMCPTSQVHHVPGEALLLQGNGRQRWGLEGKYPKAARKSLPIFDGEISSPFWIGAARGKNTKCNPVPSQGKEGNMSSKRKLSQANVTRCITAEWKGWASGLVMFRCVIGLRKVLNTFKEFKEYVQTRQRNTGISQNRHNHKQLKRTLKKCRVH